MSVTRDENSCLDRLTGKHATEQTYRAYALKPGKDTIAGVEIAGFIRPHIRGGWYIPMADGTKRRIKSPNALITVGW